MAKPLHLERHPEGGRFRQVFRSARCVTTIDGQTRSAITHIYFELGPDEVSRFHRVTSDEIWNLYRGDGVRLYTWDGTAAPPQVTELSSQNGEFCYPVPAGYWQAAEPLGEGVLVGCSVGPGFEFDDFELIDPDSALAQQLCAFDPALLRFIATLSPE